jgi:hypothetical protein
MLLGAPGTYSWRGSLFKRFPSGEDNVWYHTPVADLPKDQHGPKPATQYYSNLGEIFGGVRDSLVS